MGTDGIDTVVTCITKEGCEDAWEKGWFLLARDMVRLPWEYSYWDMGRDG